MKSILFILILLSFACQTNPDKFEATTNTNETSDFDSTLANKYGADEYGMKSYVMAFLKSGSNPPKDSTHAVKLQAAHMANIGRLAEEGKLTLAGPFYGVNKGNFRGIYIFNTTSLDSAKAYTQSDPAIKWGSLKIELINFYGSAALMGVNKTHKKITKIEM